jgi:predicted P-loop ATPase
MNDSKFLIRYSEGKGTNFAKAKNKVRSYESFKDVFRNPVRTGEKFKEYMGLTQDQQVALKAAAGWFYRTQIDGDRRNRASGRPSDIITLDFDCATPEFVESIRAGEVLSGYKFFVCSTRRHTDENPRLRAVIPCAPPVDTNSYSPVSRIVAQMVEPTMEMIDPVSFRPAQMMFYPTCSKDGDFFFYEQDGDILDIDVVLYDFEARVGDWRDYRLLPSCSNEVLRERADKAENPLEKEGPVGDFCRAYSVPQAIEAFLSDIYAPVEGYSEKPRYTYLKGTTTSGAVVEDGGLFLYSHHGSDPCCDQLVNAFDLVRIHLFGDQDKPDEGDKPMRQRASWKAMIEFAGKDRRYRDAQLERRYRITDMFDDAGIEDDDDGWDQIGDPPEETPQGVVPVHVPAVPGKRRAKVKKDWTHGLQLDQNGKILNTLSNVVHIMSNDARLRESFEFDEFSRKYVCRMPIRTKLMNVPTIEVRDAFFGEELTDFMLTVVRCVFEAAPGDALGWGMKVSKSDIHEAVQVCGRLNTFNSAKDRLFIEPWDGVPRMETLFIRYLGTEDNTYFREAARLFLIAAVARLYEPGHKFDYVPILEGHQGVGKSSFAETLAYGFFGNLNAAMDDLPRLGDNMSGNVIMEIPELSSIRRSALEATKSFITQTSITYRAAYERVAETVKRQCVFIGTTNESAYLVDRTGNRRWWPIPVQVERIDIDGLRGEVLQLWAEARNAYFIMRHNYPKDVGDLKLTLSDEAVAFVNGLHEEKMEESEVDVYAGKIEHWLLCGTVESRFDDEDEGEVPQHRYRDEVCLQEVWDECLRIPKSRGRLDSMFLAQALRLLGWDQANSRRTRSYGKQKMWRPKVGGRVVSGMEWAHHRARQTGADLDTMNI